MVKSFLIKGSGEVLSMIEKEGENAFLVCYPALVIRGISPEGKDTYTLSPMIPEYAENPRAENLHFRINNKDILLVVPINKSMEKFYLSWKQKMEQRHTGLILS
jgi:hypothetical protein